MAGLGARQSAGVTPGRSTWVEFDVGGPAILRPPWALTRRGHEIGRGALLGAGAPVNVMLTASGAWTLQSFQYQYTYERRETQQGILRASDWNLAPGLVEAPFHRKLDGVTYDAGVEETGDHFLYKTRAQGAEWAQGLEADASAFPSPTLGTSSVPLVRVAAGRETHPANQGYHLRFQAPGVQLQPHDHFFNFFFGGPTELSAAATGGVQKAGEFVASLFGDGRAVISEKLNDAWEEIRTLRFAQPGRVAGLLHNLFLTPEGPSVLGASTGSGDRAVPPVLHSAPTYPPTPPVLMQQAVPKAPRVPKRHHITGAGTPRVDQRPDLRIPWQVSVLRYPTSGVLIDGAFVVTTGDLPAGTKMFLNHRALTPAGTSITAELRDATTHTPLARNEDGTWASNAGQNRYYVRFEFRGPGTATPFLYSFEVYAQGLRAEGAATPTIGGNVRRVNVAGPDLDPSHESASLEIKDPRNELSLLRARSGMRTRIKVAYDPGDPTREAVLFEGLVVRTNARRRGRDAGVGLAGGGSRVYPSPQWNNYDVSLVGMWARLARQVAFTGKDFLTDDNASPDPDGKQPPWKATDAIRWLLEQAGAVPDQIDVPDLDIRLFSSDQDASEFELQPAGSLAEYIQKLARDYVGGFVVWDANAGSHGMWRLILPPSPPYSVLWHFTTAPVFGRIASNANAYGANTTFIRDLETWVKPPEANFVLVTSTGELGRDGSQTIGATYARNPLACNFDPAAPTADPTHPDYTDGEFVPIVYYDPSLGVDSQEGDAARAFICRRLANQTLYAQKWARIEAPMVFVKDPSDPQLTRGRPLRVYDAITIDGYEALVRSAQYEWERDHVQMMRLECLFTDNTLVA